MWHKRQVSLQTICRQTVVVVIASALGIGALSSITSAATPQLQQFLLRADEQPGFSPSGTVVAANKPSKFLHGSAKGSEAQALQNYGFVAAAGEEMTGPAGSLGNSEVIAFKSAAGAKKGLALSLSLDSSGFAPGNSVAVPGVKGSHGLVFITPQDAVVTVFWTAGSCMLESYLYQPGPALEPNTPIGGSSPQITLTQALAPVVKGIQSQYKRIGSACPSISRDDTGPTNAGITATTVGGGNSVASTQAVANSIAVKAGCPARTSTRVNTQSYPSAPTMAIDPNRTYSATVVTTAGTFIIALDAMSAPITVNNFVFLADRGFYHCVIFHRVIPGFMDQTGDPTGTGTGGPGYTIPDENPPAAADPADQYPLGSVAMANTGQPNTGGSQFFIVAGSEGESLPNTYALFGNVTTGMNVVEKINAEGSVTGVPPDLTQRILSIKVSAS